MGSKVGRRDSCLYLIPKVSRDNQHLQIHAVRVYGRPNNYDSRVGAFGDCHSQPNHTGANVTRRPRPNLDVIYARCHHTVFRL